MGSLWTHTCTNLTDIADFPTPPAPKITNLYFAGVAISNVNTLLRYKEGRREEERANYTQKKNPPFFPVVSCQKEGMNFSSPLAAAPEGTKKKCAVEYGERPSATSFTHKHLHFFFPPLLTLSPMYLPCPFRNCFWVCVLFSFQQCYVIHEPYPLKPTHFPPESFLNYGRIAWFCSLSLRLFLFNL